jgi:hypothetical protein
LHLVYKNSGKEEIMLIFMQILPELLSFYGEMNVNYTTTTTTTKKLNSMVWVRERTIPTERPPLVGEVIANFCG